MVREYHRALYVCEHTTSEAASFPLGLASGRGIGFCHQNVCQHHSRRTSLSVSLSERRSNDSQPMHWVGHELLFCRSALAGFPHPQGLEHLGISRLVSREQRLDYPTQFGLQHVGWRDWHSLRRSDFWTQYG